MGNRRTWLMLTTAGMALALFSLSLLTSVGSVAAASVATPGAASRAAAATHVDAPQLTRGFDVRNMTGTPFTYEGPAKPFTNADAGTPHIGSVLEPGAADHYEVTYEFLTTNLVDVNYDDYGDGRYADFKLQVDELNHPSAFATDCENVVCSFDGTNVTLLDPPGTVHNVPAGQGEAEAQTLNQLCDHSTLATCKFKVTKEENVLGAVSAIPPTYQNTTLDDSQYTLSCSNTVGWSDSFGGSFTLGTGDTFELVKAEVELDYHHDISTSSEFTATVELTIRPGYEGGVNMMAPMIRDWGDFTITMGNTIWNVPGVYFDSPDPRQQGNTEIWRGWVQKIGGGTVTSTPLGVRATGLKSAAAAGAGAVDGCKELHG